MVPGSSDSLAPPCFPYHDRYDEFMVGSQRKLQRIFGGCGVPPTSIATVAIIVGVSLHLLWVLSCLLLWGGVGYVGASAVLFFLWKIPFRRNVAAGGPARNFLIYPEREPLTSKQLKGLTEGAAEADPEAGEAGNFMNSGSSISRPRSNSTISDGDAGAGGRGPAAVGGDVKVLTLNIFVRPPGCPGGADGSVFGEEYKDERLSLLVPVIEKYDVVCLQEFFAMGQFRQEWLLRRAYERGFRYYSRGPTTTVTGVKFFTEWIDSGLLMLSKFPISDVDMMSFDAKCGGCRWVAKGAVYARITPDPSRPQASFHLLTTHMQASLCVPKDTSHLLLSPGEEPTQPIAMLPPKPEADVRHEQVKQIAAFLRSKVAGDRRPVLVAGDFNIDSNDEFCGGHGFREYQQTLLELSRIGSPGSSSSSSSSGDDKCNYLVRDLITENYDGAHPVTFGDAAVDATGNVIALDISLTEKKERFSQGCLDYMLLLQRPDTEPTIRDAPVQAQVEKLLVKGLGPLPGQFFTQLSDHYGLSCSLPLTLLDPTTVSSPTKK